MSDDPKLSPATGSPNPTLYLLAVVLLTLTVYGRCVTHEFLAWDDGSMVSANPILTPPSWDSLGRVWSSPTIELYTPLSYTLWSVVAVASRVETADSDG